MFATLVWSSNYLFLKVSHNLLRITFVIFSVGGLKLGGTFDGLSPQVWGTFWAYVGFFFFFAVYLFYFHKGFTSIPPFFCILRILSRRDTFSIVPLIIFPLTRHSLANQSSKLHQRESELFRVRVILSSTPPPFTRASCPVGWTKNRLLWRHIKRFMWLARFRIHFVKSSQSNRVSPQCIFESLASCFSCTRPSRVRKDKRLWERESILSRNHSCLILFSGLNSARRSRNPGLSRRIMKWVTYTTSCYSGTSRTSFVTVLILDFMKLLVTLCPCQSLHLNILLKLAC